MEIYFLLSYVKKSLVVLFERKSLKLNFENLWKSISCSVMNLSLIHI